MAIIFEDSAKVTKKQIPIPQNAKNVFKAMKKIYEPYLDKNIPGSKILKSLGSDKKYNKKGANAQTNGKEIKQDSVNVNDAKVRLHRMNKLPKNSIQYQLNGGELAANIYRKGIERARGTKEIEAVKPPKPTSNVSLKPSEIKQETVKTPSGKITYTVTAENRMIRESYDDEEHPFYDYLEDYDVNYVLDDFFGNPNGKQNWGARINPNMYAKALREFTQYGKLVNFPPRYVYQWMGIIMKNTAILETNSAIAGHREYGFYYEIADYANEHFGIELEPTYESCSNWLEEQGIYKWMVMPDGHFAVTDYGTEPLFKIIKEYNEDLPPEKILVLVNRALDVYHMQGPICSIFIQGGTKSLDKIAEHTQKSKKKVYITDEKTKKSRKKIYLSEESVKRLLEYYTQLKLPFNDTSGKGYDDKFNYEHFIDWMEYYGKYGMLPNSNVDESQLMEIINKNKQEAFKLYLDNDIEDSNYLYALSKSLSYLYSQCNDSDDLRVYFMLKEEMYENPPSDAEELMDLCDLNIEDIDDIEKILTDEGKEAFKQNMFEFFEDEYTGNGMPRELTINERGLIYIEREITVPNVLSTEIPDNTISRSSSIDTANNNYFELLRNNFVGLGSCWTWRKGKGEAYCGNFYRNGNLILLQGWVDPKDVNWEETIYRNAYSLSEEKELFINSGKMVEIDKVVVNDNIGDNYGKNILNKPILIET